MKYLKDIKNKLNWQKYYDPDFDWDDPQFWSKNTDILSINFIREFKNKVNWDYS